MAKPYIKKFGKVSNFTVWIVDGKYIRDNIDIDFVNYGQHYRYKFIPKNEFWIDKERHPGESHFYLKPLLVEYKLMKKGVNYKDVLKKSDEIEKRERAKSFTKKDIKKLKKAKKDSDVVHKRLLREYSRKLKVWIVDGEMVRDFISVDFEKGGHDKVYSFMPKNEIWIDDDVEPSEIKFILVHEMHERKLMSRGMEYLPAHKDSNKIEKFCRKNPKEIDNRLRFEILENSKIKEKNA
jgi:hypothetical protein